MSATFGPSHSSYGAEYPEIHTSDRINFKRCRRRWHFTSPLRLNRQKIGEAIAPLWTGTGCHVSLEDYHGHNIFGHPAKAWQAYVFSFPEHERPDGWEEQYAIGTSILTYYADHWLPKRNEYQTVWINGEPQVEVHFKIPLETSHGKVLYVGTFDRVVKDLYGRIYVQDYKFLKKFDTSKLDIDLQITAYTWAGKQLYGDAFEGILYHQFFKTIYEGPKTLMNGSLSKSKSNPTTYALFKQACEEKYGKVPPEYQDHLNWLMTQETLNGDMYIRWDVVRRNKRQLLAEDKKIRQEAEDMANRNLPLYPNPTPNCSWDCSFKAVCMAVDDGSDWKYMLREGYQLRPEHREWIDKFAATAELYKQARAEGREYQFVEPERMRQAQEVNIVFEKGDEEYDSPPWETGK